MKVRYTPRARSDIEEIFAYIAKDNPDAAQRVRRSIFAAIELVAVRPFMA
jgi:plasmid stabilization system protein ParE